MNSQKHILLVDDNPGDIHLTLEAFQETGMQADFSVARNGTEALAMLGREGAHCDLRAPDLIILDLNLPGIGGRELLAYVKGNELLKRIPTVILTTSNRYQDVELCYGLYANSYIVKPVQWDQFLAIVKTLKEYWFTTALLPSTIPA
jgi:CheY-like chemotaxis protein